MKFTIFLIAIAVANQLESLELWFLSSLLVWTAIFEVSRDYVAANLTPWVRRHRAVWLRLVIGAERYEQRFDGFGVPRELDGEPRYSRNTGFYLLLCASVLGSWRGTSQWAQELADSFIKDAEAVLVLVGEKQNLPYESQLGIGFTYLLEWLPALLLFLSLWHFFKRFIKGNEPEQIGMAPAARSFKELFKMLWNGFW